MEAGEEGGEDQEGQDGEEEVEGKMWSVCVCSIRSREMRRSREQEVSHKSLFVSPSVYCTVLLLYHEAVTPPVRYCST